MGPKLRSQLEYGERGNQTENIDNGTKDFEVSKSILKDRKGLDVASHNNRDKRKTIRYKANIEKKIDEVSQLITTFSEGKLKDGNNVDKTLSWANDQETKLDQFESNLENVGGSLKSKSKSIIMSDEKKYKPNP